MLEMNFPVLFLKIRFPALKFTILGIVLVSVKLQVQLYVSKSALVPQNFMKP